VSEPAPRPPVPDPCTPREVTAADGASVRWCAHGGHVLGWTPDGGTERLWLSRSTGCGPGTAIRGGVPVIWPQFAARGHGPRHGIARDRAWTVLSTTSAHNSVDGNGNGNGSGSGSEDGAARVRLELRSDAATRVLLPHPFTLTLDVAAAGDRLVHTLSARNDGVEAFTFTAALHTYLRVSHVDDVSLHGLSGHRAAPNDGGDAHEVPPGPTTVTGPLDVAIADVEGDVVLHDPVLGDLVVSAEGFDSRVVWNPGPAAPGDVHPGGETELVCVEPALLHPTTLHPGETWSGRQVLTARPGPGAGPA